MSGIDHITNNQEALASSSIEVARHLQNLNPPQKEAVLHKDGPILVLAGAGTGKTRVLTRRIANLILTHHVRPSSILAVTFTNKAAGEMKERLRLLVGGIADSIWASTFHSAGVRILRRHADKLGLKNDFSIYDSADTKDLVKKILKEKKIDDKKYSISIFTSYIDHQKHIPLFPQDITAKSTSTKEELQKEVYSAYQTALAKANAVDFGDLLAFTHKLFKEQPQILKLYQDSLDYVLVDEFQDTNTVQYDIVKMLVGSKKNLLVVGDDDQSIYAFRGATIQNILCFEKDFPNTKTVKLEQNYRSTANILEGAHAVIAKNSGRKDKKVWTAEGAGNQIEFFAGSNENEEAFYIAKEIKKKQSEGVSLRDIAIFYRTNAQSRAIEEALLSLNLPYRVFGGLKFYDRKEIKDIVAYLRLIVNPGDDQAFLRIINTPTRGIGAQTIVQLSEYGKQNQCSLLQAAKDLNGRNKHVASFVKLIEQLQKTLHTAPLFELIEDIIKKSEYGPRLKAIKDDPQVESRLENLKELSSVAASMMETDNEEGATNIQIVHKFLDRVALAGGDDVTVKQEEANPSGNNFAEAVSLMTLHLAKGLEFDLVFLTGVEEGLLPHQRTIYSPDEIDEERRLCYVGMTRARKLLHITRAKKRGIRSGGNANSFSDPDAGSSWFREPSRFAYDIPKQVFNDPMGSFFTSITDTYLEDQSGADYDFENTELNRWGNKKSKKSFSTQFSSDDLFTSGIVSSANSFANKNSSNDKSFKIDHLPLLQIDQISEGTIVSHSLFGRGTISGVDGDINDQAQNFKVLVFFDKLNDTKKLVYRYAGLRLGDSK
jgi:DNA helicase-2/ATP-dependent DNA helicase PcrA